YLAFDRDGRTVTGSADGTIAVAEHGRSRVLATDAKRMGAIAVLDAGSLLSSSGDVTAIRNIATGAETFRVAHGPRAEASPDGATIATGGPDGRVILWERASNAKLRELGTPTRSIRVIRWSPDGRRIAAMNDHGEAHVWTRDGTPIVELPGAPSGRDLAFS